MYSIQVLISAYGPEALVNIAALPHASFPGVEYLIGWQNFDPARLPKEISERDDFKVLFLNSKGLCNNRNALLEKASADLAVISDDDLVYHPEHFSNIQKGFQNYPDSHFLTFRYESSRYPKQYPEQSFDLRQPPKGYFVTSMELVLNLKKIREDFREGAVWFNPAFGVNGDFFICGEEDILLSDMLKKGFRGRYIPLEVCRNTDSTTSERIGNTIDFIQTKGAVMSHIKPFSWFPRMLVHAWRSRREIPFKNYCLWWLQGVNKARKNKVFENEPSRNQIFQ